MARLLSTIAAALLGAALSVGSAQAQTTTFHWTGHCIDDCIGDASAELTLAFYTPGDPIIGSVNFLSFSYTSSFEGTLTASSLSDLIFIGGSIDTTAPTFADFAIDFLNYTVGGNTIYSFRTQLGGTWQLCEDNPSTCGQQFNADAGDNGLWNPAPEPASLTLLGLGLLGVGLARRRRA